MDDKTKKNETAAPTPKAAEPKKPMQIEHKDSSSAEKNVSLKSNKEIASLGTALDTPPKDHEGTTKCDVPKVPVPKKVKEVIVSKPTKVKKPGSNKAKKVKKVPTKAKTKVKKSASKKSTARKPRAQKASQALATKIMGKNTPRITTCLLSAIELPDKWNRLNVPEIKGLVESIRTQGQLQPALVTEGSRPGKFLLVAGRCRYLALLQLKKLTMEVSYVNTNGAGDILLKDITTNLVRIVNTPYEIAIVFGGLVSQYGITNEQIAKACGKTTGYVSQHLAVLKGDSKLQKALSKGKIPLVIFRQINKVNEDGDRRFHDKMVEAVLKGMSAAELESRVDTYIASKASKEAAKSAQTGKPAAKKPAARGAAAHKNKKPNIKLTDYTSPAIQQQMRMIKKPDITEWLIHFNEVVLAASKREKRIKNEGIIMGLEIAAGLIEERS